MPRKHCWASSRSRRLQLVQASYLWLADLQVKTLYVKLGWHELRERLSSTYNDESLAESQAMQKSTSETNLVDADIDELTSTLDMKNCALQPSSHIVTRMIVGGDHLRSALAKAPDFLIHLINIPAKRPAGFIISFWLSAYLLLSPHFIKRWLLVHMVAGAHQVVQRVARLFPEMTKWLKVATHASSRLKTTPPPSTNAC
eukprot:1586752-Rhodomonas_salina.3